MSVSSVGSPAAGQYFQDIGSFRFTGTISPARNDQRVEIWHLAYDGSWRRSLVTSTDSSGHYRASKPVTVPGVRHFRATLGGSPTSTSTVKSAELAVTVHDAKANLATPDPSIDSLKKPTIHGTVYPAMADVLVHFQVRHANGGWHNKAAMTTGKDGKFRFTFSTGTGLLGSYHVRARRWDHRGGAWETSQAAPIKRIKVLHAVVSQTTAAEVADTYHSGCPVGPKKLRTIHLNSTDSTSGCTVA